MVIRLGIIGLSADPAAWATTTHVQPFQEGGVLADHFKLTALATSNPDSAKAAAKFHGVPLEKAYSKPEDIAKDADVDLVVVSVKVQMHKQLAMPALQAKKDVFVEWPLGASLAEAEEMAALAKKQGVRTYVCLQARLAPVMVKAKEIIDSGALGRITSTTMLGMDSSLMNLPEKARYINDPNSALTPSTQSSTSSPPNSPPSPPQQPQPTQPSPSAPPPPNPALPPTPSPSAVILPAATPTTRPSASTSSSFLPKRLICFSASL
ncbi:MAG: hypothetical protein Q9222_005588 [Ikaeria aurantiellina]